MIDEHQEQRTTEKPSWLELTEPEKQKHTYWNCRGSDIPTKKAWWRWRKHIVEPGWRVVFHSKEEAEAHASRPNRKWRWDGIEARPTTIGAAMKTARKCGDPGVQVLGWNDGIWQVLKEYPAGEPLLGDES